MDRKAAEELLHIRGWLERVEEIFTRGEDAYLADALLQEAGGSLMMKLGEAPTEGRVSMSWHLRGRVGARGGQPELPDPPVRRDQPRSDLDDAVSRPPAMEVLIGTAVHTSREEYGERV
jgi:hypothetical protein